MPSFPTCAKRPQCEFPEAAKCFPIAIHFHTDLIALISGFFWALTIVFTRKSGARESTPVQLLTTGVVFTVLSGAFLTWKTPHTGREWGLMIALGGEIYLAQYFFFEACRSAPASLVGPLEYTGVVWAALLGYLIFADVPTPHIIFGALLVSASGVVLAITAKQESKRTSAACEPSSS